MQRPSRRQFLERSSVSLGGAAALLGFARQADAYPLDGILGFQAFDVREQLAKDYDGTLRTLAGFGYKAIDLVAGSSGKTAKELRRSLDSANMICHNCHFSFAALHQDYDKTIAFAHELELKSMVCQADNARRKTLDDMKWLADELNAVGKKAQRDGLLLGYHNHEWEFQDMEGQTPFDLLLKNTDRALVKFQIDVGNLAETGKDPIAYLTRYPDRYYSLHAKDVRDGKIGIAIGEGTLDFKKIFAAAKAANIHNYDAETGAPPAEAIEKLRLSAEYLRKLKI